jgi:hypothetical protein
MMDESEKRALEMDIVLGVVALGAFALWWFRRSRRAQIASHWPIVAAKIVHSAAGEMPSRNDAGAVVGIVYLDFEYVVHGANYHGHCEEEFPSAAVAKRQLANYLSLPFYIRYHPAKPSDFSVDPYRDARGPAS